MSKLILILAAALLASIVHGQERGTFQLLQGISDRDNVAIAPTALLDALSLLYYGSSGETEASFRNVLFPEISREDAARLAGEKQRFLSGYRSIGSLWLSERLQLNEGFHKAAKENWEFHIDRVSMRSNLVDSATKINDWYRLKTNGYFKNVISPLEINEQTDLLGIIVTAFISPWENDYFARSDTSDEAFFLSSTNKFPVSMMKSIDSFPYYENSAFKGINISYANREASLLLLLPKNANDFEQLKGKISSELYNEFLDNMDSLRVQVWLPKIHYTCRIKWHEVFEKSRLSKAFTPGKAEFKNINNDIPQPLFVSALVQDVMIRWDEEGTEARSITYGPMDPFGPTPVSPPVELKKFIANHPFFYFIVNSKDRNVLFSGNCRIEGTDDCRNTIGRIYRCP